MKVLLIAAILATVSLAGCEKEDKCIDESKIGNGPCTTEYKPVCGCNGKTYSNACVAGLAGVTSYKKGECTGK